MQETLEKKCPACQSPMNKRQGKYGEFWGCTAYPECKELINIKKTNAVPSTNNKEALMVRMSCLRAVCDLLTNDKISFQEKLDEAKKTAPAFEKWILEGKW